MENQINAGKGLKDKSKEIILKEEPKQIIGYMANSHKYFYEQHKTHSIVILKSEWDQLYLNCITCENKDPKNIANYKAYLMDYIPKPEHQSIGNGFEGEEADIMYGGKEVD